MYFKGFDTISYELLSKEYEFINIFKKISFSNETRNNRMVFSDYYVIDGETIENISRTFYGNESLSWLILLANNFTNRNEFPQSLDKIESLALQTYPGNSFYFFEYTPNIKAGDVFVKYDPNTNIYDTTKYAVVQEYNSIFRYAIVRNSTGLSQNDIVGIKRLDGNNVSDVYFDVIENENSEIQNKKYLSIRKITKAIDSPTQFLNSNLNYKSPYYVNDSLEIASNTIGIYSPTSSTDRKTIYNTSLYSYSSGASTPLMKTIFQDYVDKNNKNRIIKILKKIYVNQVLQALQELLTTNDLRSKTISIEA